MFYLISVAFFIAAALFCMLFVDLFFNEKDIKDHPIKTGVVLILFISLTYYLNSIYT